MRPAQIIQILNLIDPNNPILARESLLQRLDLWALSRHLALSDPIHGLSGREERVVVVVGHLVHEGVAHSGCCFVVDAVLAAGSEEVAFFYFIWPYTFIESSALV